MWIAQLFAILALAKGLQAVFDPEKHPFALAQANENVYIASCSRCMHLAGYNQPGPLVIETLIIYAQCKFYIERNPGGEVSY